LQPDSPASQQLRQDRQL